MRIPSKRIFKVMLGMLLLASTPAIFTFASSLWLVEITADETRREDALAVLAKDVWYAKTRQDNVFWLVERPRGPQPVIALEVTENAANPPLATRFPSCHEPLSINDPSKLRHVRASGYPFNIRMGDIADTENRLFARRLGVLRLAALRSCMIATPFADQCGDWLLTQLVDEESVISELLKNGRLEKSGADFCWPQAEVDGLAKTR